jgi:hypothetical protein
LTPPRSFPSFFIFYPFTRPSSSSPALSKDEHGYII